MITIDGHNYLTVQEVCSRLDVKPATIYAYVSRGILRSYRQGIKRQRLYREDEVDALLTLQPGGEARVPKAREDEPQAIVAPETIVEPEGDLPRADGWIGEM